MSNAWREVTLGDLSEVITKGTTPTTVGFSFIGSGINFVKSESITFDGDIDTSKFAYISPDAHAALKRSQLKAGDILYSMAGVYIGKTAVVGEEILPANTNQAVGIIRLKQDVAIPRYIDFYLRNSSFRAYANSLIAQSAQPNLNLSEIKALPIRLPPLATQKAVSHLLGSLDDKIKLNRKTNETLEAIVKVLFKSWFVDFEPVRAKAEGRSTGLPKDIDDLFPDSLEQSELGEIPVGWSIATLGDLLHLDSGLAYRGALKGTGSNYLVTLGCVDRKTRFKAEGCHNYAGDVTQRHRVFPGDIIIASHDLTQARDQLGAPFIIPSHMRDKVVGAATNTYIVRPRREAINEFLYQLFRSKSFRHQMIASAKGSVILHISKDSVYSLPIILPSVPVLSAFDSIVTPFIRMLSTFERNTITNGVVRDTLLPKLMSGELRVPDAEAVVETAGL